MTRDPWAWLGTIGGDVASLMRRLFEPFVQGQREGDRRGGGLGLGLAVVKGLVTLHGGSVKAHSEGPGRGSEFVVRLPGVVAADQAERVADRSTAASGIAATRAKRVLLVDDNEDAANLMGELLESSGHEVAIAYDGPSALQVERTFKPDVALLDLGLPVMDGFELLEVLRRRANGRPCRFLALTGYGQPADVERALAAGFERLLVKPIDVDLLERLLDERAPSAVSRPR